ncbi:MAG TPA: response regulator [Polyangiaceae bacterium]|nr:response regulator [Polyangiaceae bacterium]
MRVLLVNDRRSERDALAKRLPRTGYDVAAVSDESSAMAAMAQEHPQVIVVAPPARGGDELVRRLRHFDASGQAYIVAVLDSAVSHKDISSLLEAGVNDFLRRPILDGEFIERVKGPTRLLRWVKCVAKPTAFDFSVPTDIARLHGWQNLGLIVAEDLSQIAGQTFEVAPGFPQSFGQSLLAATIPMSLAGDRLEVHVSIVVDRKGADWLRSAVLSDPSATDAMTADVLRELANTAGGALKRSALGENVTLTTGLPQNGKFACGPNQGPWTLSLPEVGACLAVVGCIQSKENQRVAASHLAEGMVIVHDVRSENGLLLVPAGSRLTSSSAARLAKALGPKFFLEVAPAA